MSIIRCSDNIVIISQETFLKNAYKSVNNNGENESFCFKDCYFDIKQPFKQKRSKKSAIKDVKELDTDAIIVKKIHEQFRDMIADSLSVNESVSGRDHHFENCVPCGEFEGGNVSDTCLLVTHRLMPMLIPPQCKFFNYDVKEISKHVHEKFDIIILDPPWWNKYIRRKRARNPDDAYNMMSNNELAEIPLNDLLKTDGLVAVWCTNSKSHIDTLKTEIFPKWGVEFVSQWFWLKVTQKGEAVTPYSPPNGKQPFERILFGCRKPRELPIPEPGKIIISVPTTLHSHKPPLSEVLRPYLPNTPKGLEIFARNLLPNFTSYGNQVLRLQHTSYFTKS